MDGMNKLLGLKVGRRSEHAEVLLNESDSWKSKG